ncbi:MAG: amidase [Dongiaceae bacterium]
MNLGDYARHDGLGLAALVRKREVSPRELCRLALDGVAAVNPRLNAVIETFPERVPASDDVPPGPFAGVPFLVKDFPIEAGVRGEMGSRLAAGFAPDRDSEIMTRLRVAGLVNLGRTAASELGLAALTASVHAGITRNPWDPARSTAGSSGGAAAAVAAGIVPIAQGGDGGGSIRNPASFCGLVGLKPSRGRISLAPDEGYPYSGMTVVFALTRSVRDCAALLDAVAGPAVGDPFEIPAPARPWLEETARPAGRLRLAFTARAWSGLPVDPEVARATAATAAACERLGLAVTEAAPAFDYDAFLAAQIDLWCAHTAASIDAVARALGRAPSEANLETTTWAVYRAGKEMSASRFLAAEAVYNEVTRAVAPFFRRHDVLLTPTNTALPLPLDRHDLNAPGATVRDLFDHLAPIETFTALFNATGQPALSLPLHWSRAGLPIGMQLVGRFGDEAALFRLAAALEQALPWRERRPAVHVAG